MEYYFNNSDALKLLNIFYAKRDLIEYKLYVVKTNYLPEQ